MRNFGRSVRMRGSCGQEIQLPDIVNEYYSLLLEQRFVDQECPGGQDREHRRLQAMDGDQDVLRYSLVALWSSLILPPEVSRSGCRSCPVTDQIQVPTVKNLANTSFSRRNGSNAL